MTTEALLPDVVAAIEQLQARGVDVRLLTRAGECAGCGGNTFGVPTELQVAGLPAAIRTCRACRRQIGVLIVSGGDLARALAAAPPTGTAPAGADELEADDDDVEVLLAALPASTCPTCRAARRDQAEREAAAELTTRDVAEARQVVEGWRVRWSLARTARRQAKGLLPLELDVEMLRLAAGVQPQHVREGRA